QVLVAACGDGSVQTWNVAYNPGQPAPALGKRLQTYHHDGATAVAFSANGAAFYSAGADKGVRAWKFAAEGPVKTFNHGAREGDAATGKLVREFKAYQEKAFPKGHRDQVFCAAFSPDGKHLASGGSDRSIKVWGVADGTVERELANPDLKAGPGQPPPAHTGW